MHILAQLGKKTMSAVYQPADMARNWGGEHSETAVRGKSTICRRRGALQSHMYYLVLIST